MAQGRTSSQQYDPSRPVSEQMPKLSLEDRLLLAKHQKKNPNLLGKLWNAPNTALGLLYGGLGYAAGKVLGTDPHASIGGNAIQFTNNPFGGVSAITIGNTTTYNGNPYDTNDPFWYENGIPKTSDGNLPYDHEEKHTYQGELEGPFYLPSNILGGLYGLLRDGDWHGSHNWNETGPQMTPPRAWPPRR